MKYTLIGLIFVCLIMPEKLSAESVPGPEVLSQEDFMIKGCVIANAPTLSKGDAGYASVEACCLEASKKLQSKLAPHDYQSLQQIAAISLKGIEEAMQSGKSVVNSRGAIDVQPSQKDAQQIMELQQKLFEGKSKKETRSLKALLKNRPDCSYKP